MPGYIEREAFIKRLENEADKSSDIINLLILNGIANIVRDENIAPAADVVEVVRCKDCKHAKEYKNNFFCCYYPVTPKSVSSDDFCSYGERKDSDENDR